MTQGCAQPERAPAAREHHIQIVETVISRTRSLSLSAYPPDSDSPPVTRQGLDRYETQCPTISTTGWCYMRSSSRIIDVLTCTWSAASSAKSSRVRPRSPIIAHRRLTDRRGPAGEIPSLKILETDLKYARLFPLQSSYGQTDTQTPSYVFLDIGPVSEGHALIIPKCKNRVDC